MPQMEKSEPCARIFLWKIALQCLKLYQDKEIWIRNLEP